MLYEVRSVLQRALILCLGYCMGASAATAGGKITVAQLADQTTVRSAWAKAVTLAKERTAGHVCEV
jgi:hypothetical protein